MSGEGSERIGVTADLAGGLRPEPLAASQPVGAHPIAQVPTVVIRVQDRFGRGPYRPGFSQVWSDPDGPIQLPWWDELGLDFYEANGGITDEYHNGCGFRSRQQLTAWFSGRELRALERHGYLLAAIRADKIHFETPTQVVFGSVQPFSVPLRACRLTSHAAEELAA